MVQFQDVFLGKDRRNYVRATSSQRAGGAPAASTMIWKTSAIRHVTTLLKCWKTLVSVITLKRSHRVRLGLLTNVLKLPQEKLWVTVYKDDTGGGSHLVKRIRRVRRALFSAWRKIISGRWAIPAPVDFARNILRSRPRCRWRSTR